MLRIYFMLKNQYLKTALEYSFNFWMMFIAGVLMRVLMMGVAFVMYRNVDSIGGFSEGEMYLLLSLIFFSEGMCNILFDGIWHLPALIFRGEFDVMLCRPVSPLYQILSYEIGLQGTGGLVLSIISLVMSVNAMHWLSPLNGLLMLLFVLTGMALRASSTLIGVSTAFFMDTGGSNSNAFTIHTVGEFAKYPLPIYPMWLRGLLFSAIPFAFIGYVPVLILRGENALMWTLLLIAVTIGYFALARGIFYRGIRKYESMGM